MANKYYDIKDEMEITIKIKVSETRENYIQQEVTDGVDWWSYSAD